MQPFCPYPSRFYIQKRRAAQLHNRYNTAENCKYDAASAKSSRFQRIPAHHRTDAACNPSPNPSTPAFSPLVSDLDCRILYAGIRQPCSRKEREFDS